MQAVANNSIALYPYTVSEVTVKAACSKSNQQDVTATG